MLRLVTVKRLQQELLKLQNKNDCLINELANHENQNVVDLIVNTLMKDELTGDQHEKLMSAVLKKVKVSDDGHLSFNMIRHKIDAVICTKFVETESILLRTNALIYHPKNINSFVKLDCDYDDNVQNAFLRHMAQTNR